MIQNIKRWVWCLAGLIWASSLSAQPNLNRVEYYIDMDPGYGQATSIPFPPGPSLTNFALNLNPGSLTSGVHILGIRARDANGGWSLDNKWLFVKPYPADSTGPGPVPNLNKIEYYLDTDPGYGKATAIPFSPGTGVANAALNINPGSVTSGVHILCIRAQDANGRWSLDNKWLFARPYPSDSTGPGPAPNLSRVEYYLDTDPGYGKATAVAFTPGTNLANINININPSSLANGIHLLGIRAQDAKGDWSLDNKWLFARPYPADSTGPGPILNLTQIEYYFDKDPGFGKGIPVAINPVTNLPNFKLPINIAGLSAGVHILFIRSKNVNGAWSLDNKFNFAVSSAIAAPAIVVNSVSKKIICDKDTLMVSYQADGTYNTGNIFRVELSDANANFTAPKVIGSYTGTGNTTIICPLPDNLPIGNNYRVRVSSTNPVVTGVTGSDSLAIHVRPAIQTITGDSNVNVTLSYPYSVPAVAGSAWTWVAPAATITQTANSANLLWNIAGQQTIKVIQTDQFGCRADTSRKNVNVYALHLDSIKVSTLSICAGNSLVVTAKAFGAYKAGNVFTAQLSSATGSFTSPTTIGKDTANPVGNAQLVTIHATIPKTQALGTGYRIRITASSPVVTSADNGQNISINCVAAAITSLTASDSGHALFDRPAIEGNAILLYPNPAKDVSTLVFTAAAEEQYSVEVSDAVGKVLLVREGKSTIGQNLVSLNISNYAHGIYFVSLLDKVHGRRTLKLVKLE
ncbi:MAG: hypothetical protein BGO55_00200 [Sphingobacteriales bacterium 50-39]|nr:T9SS type A sorting domain-containing protein [Sphingobacteriales bacterium]OJW53544.1 MAG: hypothetical protein BGO55_00200 [Sphingobacteriales bacterium 50-39]